MRIYTCTTAVLVPSSINVILNVLIFRYVRSSVRRIQPGIIHTLTNSINNINQPIITRREISLLQQMIFTFLIFIIGWTPVYLTLIISYFVVFDSNITSATALVSQLCTLCIITNLFIYNHELKQYFKDKIRLHL